MHFDGTYNIEIILGLITSLFGAYLWKYNNIKTKLQESHYRYRHTLLLQKSSFEDKYKSSLSSLIKWVESIYNNSTLVLNYSRHITIALIYSFMAFILFWVLGASGSIGDVLLLNDNLSLQEKISILFFFILHTTFIYLILKYLPKWVNHLLAKLPSKLQKSQFFKTFSIAFILTIAVMLGTVGLFMEILKIEMIGTFGRVGIGMLIGMLTGGVIGSGTIMNERFNKIQSYLQLIFAVFLSWFIFILVFLGNLAISLAIAFALTLFSIPSILTLQRVGFGINLIFLGLILLLLIDSSNKDDIIAVSLFLLILPLLNALLDYISLKVSLFMAKKVLRDASILKVLFHLLVDTLIAIAFLYMLALFLYFSIDFLNGFIDKKIPIHEIFLGETGIKNEPFNLQSGWITFMLMSTLVPTFMHFIIAFGALLIEVFPSQKALNDLNIYEQKQEAALLDTASHYFTRIFFAEILLGFGMIGMMVFVGLYVF